MSVLVISAEDKIKIKEAIATARSNPTPWNALAKLADATSDHKLPFEERRAQLADEVYKQYPTQSFLLGNVRVAFNFEYQPVGLLRHMSVALAQGKKGDVPNYQVIRMLALEFGFSDFPPLRHYRVWNEEYEPQHFAVNIIELEEAA